MEESEKRRERLEAMRKEAAHGEVNTYPGISGAPSFSLSNPLLESDNVSETPFQQASRRFDYYTDPTSAFSGRTEASSNANPPQSPHSRPAYKGKAPTSDYHYPAFRSPAERMNHVPGAYQSQPYPRSSFEAQSSWPQQAMAPRTPNHHYQASHQTQTYPGSPIQAPNSIATQHGRPWIPPDVRANAFTYRSRPNFVRPMPYTMYNQSMDRRYKTGFFDGSGRGRGRNNTVSAKERPDLYYKRGMVEDPWKNMTPVTWKGPGPGSDGSWMPKSITGKKAKVSVESSKTMFSQGSLAQFLSEALNDSTVD